MNMVKIKIKDLRNKNQTELTELLGEGRGKLLELGMKSHQTKPKNVKEARELRKNIARILTLLKKQ